MNSRIEALEKRSSSELNRLNRKLYELDGQVKAGIKMIGDMDTKIDTIGDILLAWNNTKGFVNTIRWLSKVVAIVAIPLAAIITFIVAIYCYGKTGVWKSPY